MNNNEVVEILNGLIETCKNCQEVYRASADTIRNSEFRRLFTIFSQQRAQFASELQEELHRLGGEPSAVGTAPASLQRGWINVKPTIKSGDEASIIVECQHAEEAAVSNYQDALSADLPLDVQYVVKRQYMDIKDAYDRIRILQRAA